METEIKAALIGAFFGLFSGIGGTLITVSLADPGDERLQQIEAESVKDLSSTFTNFIQARENMMSHLKNAPAIDADVANKEAFIAQAKKLEANWRERAAALGAVLHFDQAVFDDEHVQMLIGDFIEWNDTKEKERAVARVESWVSTKDYQDWRERILKATAKAVKR